MGELIEVNPFRCRVWSLHDRLDEHITEQSCKGEIASIEKRGQRVPTLGRRLLHDPDYEVELIYGARRLFVARHINRPLKVELCELSDRDALVAMHIENALRQDISPYERGRSYAHWLRTGHFTSQEDIAEALDISASQVSRLLKMARLPSVIVGSFRAPVDICESWGLALADALEDPGRRPAIVYAARTIGERSPRPSSQEVYQKLISASAAGRKPKVAVHDRVVFDSQGKSLFRIQYRRSAIAVVLPIEKTPAKILSAIEMAVAEILERSGVQLEVVDRGTGSTASVGEVHQMVA